MSNPIGHIRHLPIIFLGLLFGCTPRQSGNVENFILSEGGPEYKINIYQLTTRLFGNTRSTNIPYGTMEQNGAGKFNDINDTALDSIKALGITHIWYMGVIEHAVCTDYTNYGIPLDDADVVKGRAGSPYAIKDYYDVNPDLASDIPARMKEFERLVERTHRHGLKVIIDFVPNHVARNYHSDAKPAGVKDLGEDDDVTRSFLPTNNFYYLPGEDFKVPAGYIPLGPYSFPTKDGRYQESPARVTGNHSFKSQPDINDWFETIKLNYGIDYREGETKHFSPVPDTWNKMLEILTFWAGKNVDGFRCDMVQMVPVEFWSWVIPRIKAIHPEILFIAEIYEPGMYLNYLNTGGFDILYDKVQLYDTLRNIITGKGFTSHIPGVMYALKGINHRMLRFLENHDEQRIASRFFAGDPVKALPAMVLSSTIYKNPTLIFFGQEIGEPGDGITGFKGDDGRTTHFDYWGVQVHQQWMNGGHFDGGLLSPESKKVREFYKTLLNLSLEKEVLQAGDFFDLYSWNMEISEAPGDEEVYYYLRYLDHDLFLIVLNFSEKEKKDLVISIPQQIRDRKIRIRSAGNPMTDLMGSGNVAYYEGKNKVKIPVGSYTGLIFDLD